MSKESTDRYEDLIINGNDIPKKPTLWAKILSLCSTIKRWFTA